MTVDHAEGTIRKEGPEGEEPSIVQDGEGPQSITFYHPSKSSSVPFPSQLKKQKKDDDDERLYIQLADRSIKYPVGVCENLLFKINKFIFPVDFVVLEMDEDELVSIILGWPFLATARAIIDVHEGRLSLRVGNETITFNIGKSMKYKCSRDDYLYYADHTTKLIREQWVDTVDYDEEWIESEEGRDSDEVWAVSFYPKAEPVEPPKLELKSYPDIEKANS
ncbi:reverse transcriptase [Tanacetum coccineum]